MAKKDFEAALLEYLSNMAASLASIAETLDDMNVNGVKVEGTGAYISPYPDEESEDLPGVIDVKPEKQPDE